MVLFWYILCKAVVVMLYCGLNVCKWRLTFSYVLFEVVFHVSHPSWHWSLALLFETLLLPLIFSSSLTTSNNPFLLMRLAIGNGCGRTLSQNIFGQSFCSLVGICKLFREPAITRQLFERGMVGSLTSTKSPNASWWSYSVTLQWVGEHIDTSPFMQNTRMTVDIWIKIATSAKQLSTSTS